MVMIQMGDQANQSETNIEEEVRIVVEQAKDLQDAASSMISKSSRDEKELQQRACSLDKSIVHLRSSIGSLTCDGQIDPRLAEKVFHQSLKELC